MTITTQAFRFALTAAALCAAASTAHAKPKRVVILDFDGPRQLADSGRSAVMSILGEQYDVVSTKSWDKARNDASRLSHGPEQWMKAAKQSGVGAVIEGMVQEEGRRRILNITVRQADNGKEFDTISIRMDKAGLSNDATRELQSSLDQVLYWIDTGHNETTPVYPAIPKNKLGPSKVTDDATEETVRPRARRPVAELDDAVDEAPARRKPAKAERDDRDSREVRDARETREARDDRDDRDDRVADEPAHDPKPTTVGVTDPEVHDISVLFPQSSEDRERLNPRANHVPQKTPRFQIDAGGYMSSRSLTFTADADANITQFAGVQSKGFAVNAAVYPFPSKQMDGGLQGVGFTASLHHSAVSSVEFDNTNESTLEEYVLNQNGWELGVHYRAPLSNLITVDGSAVYGNQTYEIVDASPNFEVPDTKYSYLGIGGHLDLAITERAQIGFGARYFTVLDTGDLSSVDWYGPAHASGLGLDASFQIPLPSSLYVRGQLSYQRISLELSGGGTITDEENVTGGTDSMITGNVNLGIAF